MGNWLYAKQAAAALQEEIRNQAEDWTTKGIVPRLAVLLVEGDAASSHYASAKQRLAEKLGLLCEVRRLPKSVSQSDVIQLIELWNCSSEVHGVLLELPLPEHLNARVILQHLRPDKDVDGMTPANKLAAMTGAPGLYPATPQACIRLLQEYGYALKGRHAVLVGRGETVGMPLLHLLLRENATVTVCHSATQDLKAHLQRADFAFVAAGRRGLITREMVHPGLVIIDAGINETETGGLAGDVEADVLHHVEALSPTPGGVGTLTTSLLLANVLRAMELQINRTGEEQAQ